MIALFSCYDWYSDWKFKTIAPTLVEDLVEAAGRLTRDRKAVDPPHMVAALHFGFWTHPATWPDGGQEDEVVYRLELT